MSGLLYNHYQSSVTCWQVALSKVYLSQIFSPVLLRYSWHITLCKFKVHNISSVQLLSCVWLFVTPWTTARQASLSITNSQSLFKLMSIESVMPSSHLVLCHPLLLLPPIPPSIRVFSNESTLCIRWSKYWSFSFNIRLSNEYSGLISFRMEGLDLLAVQGTLKSLLQHQNLKGSILLRSAFFMVQLSHPYMTTGKTIVLTRRTFVGKVMSLLLNMLSRLVTTFLPEAVAPHRPLRPVQRRVQALCKDGWCWCHVHKRL